MGTDSNLSCFILSAGFGTRMGEIGKCLPKPLWSIGDKTLIEATKAFWESHGIKTFYANVHHGQDAMVEHLNEIGITPVIEDELLGSGGAYYNLKAQFPELKKVLAVNCDSFPLSYSSNDLGDFLSIGEEELLSMPVLKDEKFNRLDIRGNHLKGIIKEFSQDGVTYAGISIISLENLPQGKDKIHGFFDSVANFNEKQIKVKNGVIQSFLDFGTTNNFYHSYFELLNDASLFVELKERLSLKQEIHLDKIIYLDNSKSPLSNQFKTGIQYKGFFAEV